MQSDASPNESLLVPAGAGSDIRAEVFRDTKAFYAQKEIVKPSGSFLRFVRKYAGHQILDLGCATGGYCVALTAEGYAMRGADLNPEYVRIARNHGVEADQVGAVLPYADGAFDTVMIFEVLEHLPDPASLLREAKRVARRNVLITVPNCEKHAELRRVGLLMEHFADADHRNFFTADSLTRLLSAHFSSVGVRRGDPINPLALVGNRWVRGFGSLARRLGLWRAHYHFRLFAVAEL